LAGIGIYIFTNSETATEWTTGALIAPVVEESLKGMAVVAVYLLFMSEFDSLLDGMIYAAIVALGFAATENTYYIYNMGFVKNSYEGLLVMAFIRNILVGWQHPFYTSFIGIGLAISRLNRNLWIKIGAPLLGWSFAVLTHAVHNLLAQMLEGSGGLIFGTLIDWTGWFFVFCILLLAIRSEQKTISLQLREEVSKGIISSAQYATACSAWAQSLARLGGLFTGRYQATNRFYQIAAELAHKKNQLNRMGDESGNQVIIERLRSDLAHLAPLAER
jgi:hypothetical protein